MLEIGHGRRGYSSGVEHSTADREVPGSIPGVPLIFESVSLVTFIIASYFLENSFSFVM